MPKESKKEAKGRGIPLETHQQSKAYVQQVEVYCPIIPEIVKDLNGGHQSTAGPPELENRRQKLLDDLHQTERT